MRYCCAYGERTALCQEARSAHVERIPSDFGGCVAALALVALDYGGALRAGCPRCSDPGSYEVIAYGCHQEKTCEDITPYGVITQFPKNGRLFTPKYRLITPSTFDHTEKNLFTPSIYKITPS